MLDGEVIEERRLEIQVKMKEKKKKNKEMMKMMGWQKKEMVIPQELQIQKMIQPTYGTITIKSVKISKGEQ